MGEWFSEHQGLVLGVAGAVAGLWVLGKLLHRKRDWRNVPVKAYCNHCNWEGKIQRGHLKCGRCGSADLHVIGA